MPIEATNMCWHFKLLITAFAPWLGGLSKTAGGRPSRAQEDCGDKIEGRGPERPNLAANVDWLPAPVDAELTALFRDEALSILLSGETGHSGIFANAARDFNRERPVTGVQDFVPVRAHAPNMRPESVCFHPLGCPRAAGFAGADRPAQEAGNSRTHQRAFYAGFSLHFGESIGTFDHDQFFQEPFALTQAAFWPASAVKCWSTVFVERKPTKTTAKKIAEPFANSLFAMMRSKLKIFYPIA
jgi:hypothetical protein